MDFPEPTWPTMASLYLEPIGPTGRVLSSATGFLIRVGGWHALVTARHVVTGLHDETKKPLDTNLATPRTLRVWDPARTIRAQKPVEVSLLDEDDEPRYWQTRSFFDGVQPADLAVLPFEVDARQGVVRAYELDPPEQLPDVASSVWVIGYPQRTRLTQDDLAVWSRGSVASDPAQLWHGERFLIDSRTRAGQSGAPVIRYVPQHDTTSPDGQSRHHHPPSWSLLGVYSGRLSADSDLGSVWTTQLLAETVGLV